MPRTEFRSGQLKSCKQPRLEGQANRSPSSAASHTFFHPDCYRRPRSFTGSCTASAALAGFTAGREWERFSASKSPFTHPAPKVGPGQAGNSRTPGNNLVQIITCFACMVNYSERPVGTAGGSASSKSICETRENFPGAARPFCQPCAGERLVPMKLLPSLKCRGLTAYPIPSKMQAIQPEVTSTTSGAPG